MLNAAVCLMSASKFADLIADERGQQAWAKRFARLLPQARNAGKFDFRNIPRDDNRKEYVRRH